mgnify:CR=1 FL=1
MYTANAIRNICLLGHSGSGKTALAESLLYMTGAIDRIGKNADGNTVCDYDPEEIRRHVSISSAVVPLEYKNIKINLLDTPGGFDFSGAVMEALRSDREIEKIIVGKGAEGSIKKIIGMAKDKKIPINYSEKSALDRMADGRPHQGVAAHVSAYTYCDVEDILARAEERGEDPFIIILDGLEDPHNLGAVLRTADAVSADGVIIKKTHSAGLTPTVAKVSAGAIDTVKVAAVTNLTRTVQDLKKQGYWIVGADMDGQDYRSLKYDFNAVLIIGNEGKGISRLLRQECDYVVSLPMKGRISSLNASVSAGILMYEISSQRFPL